MFLFCSNVFLVDVRSGDLSKHFLIYCKIKNNHLFSPLISITRGGIINGPITNDEQPQNPSTDLIISMITAAKKTQVVKSSRRVCWQS